MGCSSHNTNESNFEELCIEALKKAGCRITKPRLTVIRLLAKTNTPFTAPEIFELISKKKNKETVDKVSVYRTLETLLELKLIHRTMPSGAYIACSHQECVNSYHVLSRCQDCNKVEELDVPTEVVAPLLFHLENALKFSPDSHLLHMEGQCASCSLQ